MMRPRLAGCVMRKGPCKIAPGEIAVGDKDAVTGLVILGTLLGTAESLILPPVVPLRLGLANIATLAAILLLGFRGGLRVTVMRSILTGVATGGLFAMPTIFSLVGGIASAVVMAWLARLPVSVIAISASGGCASSLMQVLLFALIGGLPWSFVVETAPWFTSWGTIAGAVVGLILQYARKPIPEAAV